MTAPMRALFPVVLLVSACAARQAGVPPTLANIEAPSIGTRERSDGLVGTAGAGQPPVVTDVAAREPSAVGATRSTTSDPARYSLNFDNADIRDIARQVLGQILKVTYTVDPTIRGTGTVATAAPVTRAQAFRLLDAMLVQNGATLVVAGGLYRVVPVAGVATSSAGSSSVGGTEIVPLHYGRAETIAKLLQNYVSEGVLVTAEPTENAILIGGDIDARSALIGLIGQLDTDLLQGVSYTLFPVTEGEPAELAAALGTALGQSKDDDIGGPVRVIPLDRVNAVLVVAHREAALEEAKRIFSLIEVARRTTTRSWHIHFVQNSDCGVATKVLRAAFPPVTGNAPSPATETPAPETPTPVTPAAPAEAPPATDAPYPPAVPTDTPPADQSATQAAHASGHPTSVRIVPYTTLNAIMTYATAAEEATITAMLAKIDLVPRQVKIDAVLSEFTATDNLNYGTQFSTGGQIQAVLTTGAGASITPGGQGLAIYHLGKNGADVALSLLAQAGSVKVLSSPQLALMDNTQGSLTVGSLVPYLSGSATSLTTATAEVVNSVNYAQTGVILNILPRIGADGQVTLALDQELSAVDTTMTSTIGSPSFTTRTIQTSVSIEDGQTIAIAGITRDNVSDTNAGIPFLKDVPVLGAAASTQQNARTRTEIVLLLTPHIIRDETAAQALTEDLRAGLPAAAFVPQQLRALPPAGSPNPNGSGTSE